MTDPPIDYTEQCADWWRQRLTMVGVDVANSQVLSAVIAAQRIHRDLLKVAIDNGSISPEAAVAPDALLKGGISSVERLQDRTCRPLRLVPKGQDRPRDDW